MSGSDGSRPLYGGSLGDSSPSEEVEDEVAEEQLQDDESCSRGSQLASSSPKDETAEPESGTNALR